MKIITSLGVLICHSEGWVVVMDVTTLETLVVGHLSSLAMDLECGDVQDLVPLEALEALGALRALEDSWEEEVSDKKRLRYGLHVAQICCAPAW
jgi:hypothetical protein